MTIAALPMFSVAPNAAVVDALDRAEVRLINTANDSVVASQALTIGPDDLEWIFEITLELLESQVLELRLEVELIDATPIIEVVEFAGLSLFQVQASLRPTEIRAVNLV